MISDQPKSLAEREIRSWALNHNDLGPGLSWEAINLPINITEQRRHISSIIDLSRERIKTMRETDALRNRFLDLQIKKARKMTGLGASLNLGNYNNQNMKATELLRQKSINMRLMLTQRKQKESVVNDDREMKPFNMSLNSSRMESSVEHLPLINKSKNILPTQIKSPNPAAVIETVRMNNEHFPPIKEISPMSLATHEDQDGDDSKLKQINFDIRPATQDGQRVDDYIMQQKSASESENDRVKPSTARASFAYSLMVENKGQSLRKTTMQPPLPIYKRVLQELRTRRPTTRSARRRFLKDPRCSNLLASLQPAYFLPLTIDDISEIIECVKLNTGFPTGEEEKNRRHHCISVACAEELRQLFLSV